MQRQVLQWSSQRTFVPRWSWPGASNAMVSSSTMRPCRQFGTYHWQNSKLEQRTYFQFLLLLLHSRLLFLLPEVEREGVEALFLLLLLHSLLLFLLPEVAREGVEALSRLQFHLQHVEDEAEVEDEGGEPLLTALACATQGSKILV